ncbi:MAG: N-acetylmuramidase family protein, partial [Muribaculaceae bacterium]|nr:N-acetylmuramidase family protein [Muribaculaceae bacterium]
MKRLLVYAIMILMGVSAFEAGASRKRTKGGSEAKEETAVSDKNDSTALLKEMSEMVALVLTEMPAGDAKVKYKTLTDKDFEIVAKELGVEVAAIKAVVKIEAGPKLEGFWAPGVPVVNYVQSLFNKYNGKTKARKQKDAKVPSGLTGYALKEWTSLTNARKVNANAADMGSYWGMFQIGGFNYKL